MLTDDEDKIIRRIQRDLAEEWLAWTDDYQPSDLATSVTREHDFG